MVANCSSVDRKGRRNGLEGLEDNSHTPPSRGDRLHFSPCNDVEKSGGDVAAAEDAESDHFKNKRAAHYNEFKLGAALSRDGCVYFSDIKFFQLIG